MESIAKLEEILKERLLSSPEIKKYYIEYGSGFLNTLIKYQPVKEEFLWEYRNELDWRIVIRSQVFPLDLRFYNKFWDYIKVDEFRGIETYQPVPIWFVEKLYPGRKDIIDLFKISNNYLKRYKFSGETKDPWMICYVNIREKKITDFKRVNFGMLSGYFIFSFKEVIIKYHNEDNFNVRISEFVKVRVYLRDIITNGIIDKFEVLGRTNNLMKRFIADVT